jgi:hypothetical protein
MTDATITDDIYLLTSLHSQETVGATKEMLTQITQLRNCVKDHIFEIWGYMPLIEQLQAHIPATHHAFPDHLSVCLSAIGEVDKFIEHLQAKVRMSSLQ